jgi:hypothetical protein
VQKDVGRKKEGNFGRRKGGGGSLGHLPRAGGRPLVETMTLTTRTDDGGSRIRQFCIARDK